MPNPAADYYKRELQYWSATYLDTQRYIRFVRSLNLPYPEEFLEVNFHLDYLWYIMNQIDDCRSAIDVLSRV